MSKQRIYSVIVILCAFFCLYFYGIIFTSSLRYENNKSLFNAKYFNHRDDIVIDLERGASLHSGFLSSYVRNPAELELKLRADLMGSDESRVIADHSVYYQELLKRRPSWPYYFSGLMQSEFANKHYSEHAIKKAMYYGPHEKQVVLSLAELLFFYWEDISDNLKNEMMAYLMNQSDILNSIVVKISAKFAKIYQYCDFIYDKKHVEYAACKQQYWKPLVR